MQLIVALHLDLDAYDAVLIDETKVCKATMQGATFRV